MDTGADNEFSHALFDLLWNRTPISLAAWDRELRYVTINASAANANGLAPDAHVGKTVGEVIGGDVALQVEELQRQVLAQGEAIEDVEVEGKWPARSRRIVRASFYPITRSDGELVGVGSVAFDTTTIVQEHEGATAHAEAAGDEYRRALRDYSQLMRHRLANPLTAITAGINTLLQHDLDAEVRRKVLRAMEGEAVALEQVTLHPHTLGEEEHDLHPTTGQPVREDSSLDRRGADRERRAGRNEAHFRNINEEMITGMSKADAFDCICECARLGCADIIRLRIAEYTEYHESPACFVVVPQHVDPAIEDVIHREDDFWVVRKFGAAREQAEAMQ